MADPKAFKHDLGIEVISKVAKIPGIITSRSQNLFGCNRYYIQPPANEDHKVPDGWWVDEYDITVVNPVPITEIPETADPGGPMSKIR